MRYTQEAMCTKCGWFTPATEGSLFLALSNIGSCLGCETKIERTPYPVSGEPFILVDVTYVHRPVWYSPNSWFTLKRKVL